MVNVVSDIKMMRITVTIFVAVLGACTKVAESGAPRIVAWSACATSSALSGPIVLPWGMPLRTRKSAKKIGDCSRMGMQDEKGLVPRSL